METDGMSASSLAMHEAKHNALIRFPDSAKPWPLYHSCHSLDWLSGTLQELACLSALLICFPGALDSI